jgi:hypothetical protein
MDLNAVNVVNRHLRDVQNVKTFGIVQEIVKLVIGLSIRPNVMQERNR